jgi:hypothetical protein
VTQGDGLELDARRNNIESIESVRPSSLWTDQFIRLEMTAGPMVARPYMYASCSPKHRYLGMPKPAGLSLSIGPTPRTSFPISKAQATCFQNEAMNILKHHHTPHRLHDEQLRLSGQL